MKKLPKAFGIRFKLVERFKFCFKLNLLNEIIKSPSVPKMSPCVCKLPLPHSVLWHIAKWDLSVLSSEGEFLALVQGVSGLTDQEVWVSSFPYTRTKKWLQWCEIWEGIPWRPLASTLCSWVQFNAKVTEQVGNPAGLGSAPCTRLPSWATVFCTGPGCRWRALWPQEQKHSSQHGCTCDRHPWDKKAQRQQPWLNIKIKYSSIPRRIFLDSLL